ncbi:MAG: c-type cytochrome [Pseudomonadota bacterium]
MIPDKGRDRRFFDFLVALGLCSLQFGGWADAAERGAQMLVQFKFCQPGGYCSETDPTQRLDDIFSQPKGTVKELLYSDEKKHRADETLALKFETSNAAPRVLDRLPSYTRVDYRASTLLPDQAGVLVVMQARSASPKPLLGAQRTASHSLPELAPEILAIPGDREYGAYLSAECITCHQADGSYQGIPSITNWPEEEFVIALHSYKQGIRPNPVMQMIAGRLGDEEIAALAAYFKEPD